MVCTWQPSRLVSVSPYAMSNMSSSSSLGSESARGGGVKGTCGYVHVVMSTTRGYVITASGLIGTLWGMDDVGEGTLCMCVCVLLSMKE